MLKDKLSDLYQIFTFPRKLVQINNSAVTPSSPATPITPITPFGMSREEGSPQSNGDPENPISPTAVKPDTDHFPREQIFQRRLTFDHFPKEPPYPPYLRILKQVAAVIVLFLAGVIVIGSIHDYTRYEVSTSLDIKRTPPPYHITLCLDIPDIIITSKLPIELQTKISAFKSKSRSDFIQAANEEISKEMTVDEINQATPGMMQIISGIKIGEKVIPVDPKNVLTFFKGLSKCFTARLDNLDWYKFFESNLVIKLHDKTINNVKVYIHYDNLIHGDRRPFKVVNFNSGGGAVKVILSYRVVRRLFLPPPYVTNCQNYAHEDDPELQFDSKAAAVDMCVMKRTLVAMEGRVPDHLILVANSTAKYTTVKVRGFGTEAENADVGGDQTRTILSNVTKECLDLYPNSDCIDDTIIIYETERELVTPDLTDYEPEIVITNPVNDFTAIMYVPLKTLGDEIFAATGAIGFLVALFLLISYLSKVVLRVCNKKK